MSASSIERCRLGVSFGPESGLYSFPDGHPMNSRRTELFAASLTKLVSLTGMSEIIPAVQSSDADILSFHTRNYVDFVRRSSETGTGYLDYGDTPSFKGVLEASKYVVGNSLNGLRMIIEGDVDHFFNPVGGLHHARRDRAGGFCVFNDSAIAITESIQKLGLKKVAYVDIDAHHGDGVYYGSEEDPRVIIADIHEDGRFLYPGTGSADESGKGEAKGTKLNLPLPPGSGDAAFFEAFDKAASFVERFKPDFIFLQCGADGLRGDPLTHLSYSPRAHAYAARKLHELAHRLCDGRILAMGGGGYNPENVRDAWMSIAQELSGNSQNALKES